MSGDLLGHFFRLTSSFLFTIVLFSPYTGLCDAADVQWSTSEPLRRIEQDTDQDGHIDRIAVLDKQGTLTELSADTDGDGIFDTFQKYEAGVVVLLGKDTDNDGYIDERDVFKNGRRVRHETLAANGDIVCMQSFDENGVLMEWRQDNNGDSSLDTVRRYDDGGLASMDIDTSGDGVFDTFQTYQNGLLTRQRQDKDGDGLIEITTEMDNGKPVAASEDTDRDGNVDIWRKYKNGVLVSTEEDRDHDGGIDAKTSYDEEGCIVCSLLDDDGDGFFEVRIRLGNEKWSRIVEITDNYGELLESQVYSGEILRKRSLMDGSTGLPVFIETFDENGRIIMSREALETPGRFDMAWYYDERGEVARAESDRDEDGNIDTWYYYKSGVVVRIEEDRDRDGKPDLWEEYVDGDTLLSRREDLNFDGTADIEKKF